MSTTPLGFILILLLAVPVGIAGLVYLVVPICKGLRWLIAHVFAFVFGELGDALRLVGGVLTTIVLVPLTIMNVILGRWSGASHYGRAIQSEVKALGAGVYRLVIGHPMRLLCLGALTEGIEKRIPEAVAFAPGADRPGRRVGQFEGYNIVGSLAGGGSGGKLYIADPTPQKLAALTRSGAGEIGQVVIKAFSLRDGSSLPQIVRENRALPAAKRLGLILEHELTDERFFYVMRYVPGESLGLVTQRLHAESGADGLADRHLHDAIEFGADLARTLCHYHNGGLWHKDVKPDNIIIAGGQAHLVDFGLITPLRSSMTLTTHGTEYFRDPEMVRMALRGVKVHEVDGVKFDVYGAGAVLYSVIENSFPAHGGLSQISKRCPEALRWIVRRAMTDYDKRYPSAGAMLADLEAVAAAADPFAMKPAMLPSFRAGDEGAVPASCHEWEAAAPAMAGAFAGSRMVSHGAAAVGAGAARPARLKLVNWWSGKYELDHGDAAPPSAPVCPVRTIPAGATAAAQLARARARAHAAQSRARARMRGYTPGKFRPLNAGIGVAVLGFFVFIGLVTFMVGGRSSGRSISVVQERGDGTSRVVRIGRDGIHVHHGSADQEGDESAEYGAEIERAAAAVGLPVSVDPAIRVRRRGPAIADQGQVMVLRDPITFEKAARPEVDAQLASLQDAGFKLRGDSGATGGVDEAGETELVAELRSQLGLTPFASADAREVVQTWLTQHPQMGAVVWVARSDDGQPEAWLIGRTGVEEGVLDAATSAMTLVERR